MLQGRWIHTYNIHKEVDTTYKLEKIKKESIHHKENIMHRYEMVRIGKTKDSH